MAEKRITANRVALAGGAVAVLAFLFLSGRGGKEGLTLEELLRREYPNASDAEIKMMVATWMAWAALQRAQMVDEAQDLQDKADETAVCQTEAARLQAIYIANPTQANKDAYDYQAAICAGLQDDFKLALEITLSAYEETLRSIGTVPYTPRSAGTLLGDAEIAYASALAIWQTKVAYIDNRTHEISAEGFVWEDLETRGHNAAIAWGEYPKIAALGYPEVTRIRSALVLKGAKMTLYRSQNFEGFQVILDAVNQDEVYYNVYQLFPPEGGFIISPQSLKMEPSLQWYIDDAQNAHITCVSLWASLIGLRSVYNDLVQAVLDRKAIIAIFVDLNARADALLSSMNAMISYINATYPIQP